MLSRQTGPIMCFIMVIVSGSREQRGLQGMGPGAGSKARNAA